MSQATCRVLMLRRPTCTVVSGLVWLVPAQRQSGGRVGTLLFFVHPYSSSSLYIELSSFYTSLSRDRAAALSCELRHKGSSNRSSTPDCGRVRHHTASGYPTQDSSRLRQSALHRTVPECMCTRMFHTPPRPAALDLDTRASGFAGCSTVL